VRGRTTPPGFNGVFYIEPLHVFGDPASAVGGARMMIVPSRDVSVSPHPPRGQQGSSHGLPYLSQSNIRALSRSRSRQGRTVTLAGYWPTRSHVDSPRGCVVMERQRFIKNILPRAFAGIFLVDVLPSPDINGSAGKLLKS